MTDPEPMHHACNRIEDLLKWMAGRNCELMVIRDEAQPTTGIRLIENSPRGQTAMEESVTDGRSRIEEAPLTAALSRLLTIADGQKP